MTETERDARMHAHVCRQRTEQSTFIAPHFTVLESSSLTKAEFTVAARPANQPALRIHLSPTLGTRLQTYAAMPRYLSGGWGFELQSFHLQNKSSYPLNHLFSPSHPRDLKIEERFRQRQQVYFDGWTYVGQGLETECLRNWADAKM